MVDAAVQAQDAINAYLRQGGREPTDFDDVRYALAEVSRYAPTH